MSSLKNLIKYMPSNEIWFIFLSFRAGTYWNKINGMTRNFLFEISHNKLLKVWVAAFWGAVTEIWIVYPVFKWKY